MFIIGVFDLEATGINLTKPPKSLKRCGEKTTVRKFSRQALLIWQLENILADFIKTAKAAAMCKSNNRIKQNKIAYSRETK